MNCPLSRLTFTLAAVVLALSETAAQSPTPQRLPPAFVYLRDVDPTIVQDIRYATADNFTGRPLAGYNAAECVLRRDVALALARVQQDLAALNLGLKVYDCYRPERAVRAMMTWANDGTRGGARRFYPTRDKRTLFAAGFISTYSVHSSGAAVDLTLVARPAPAASPFDPAATYGPCTAPADSRAPDNSLDMGTGFDCFDNKSRTASSALTPAQRQARDTLVRAMRKRGFHNYFREWWHYTYGAPSPHYDVPIVKR